MTRHLILHKMKYFSISPYFQNTLSIFLAQEQLMQNIITGLENNKYLQNMLGPVKKFLKEQCISFWRYLISALAQHGSPVHTTQSQFTFLKINKYGMNFQRLYSMGQQTKKRMPRDCCLFITILRDLQGKPCKSHVQ